jgi:hypothetical protein
VFKWCGKAWFSFLTIIPLIIVKGVKNPLVIYNLPGPFDKLNIGKGYSVSDGVDPVIEGKYLGMFHVFEKENGEHAQYFAGIGNNEPYVVSPLAGKRRKTRKYRR